MRKDDALPCVIDQNIKPAQSLLGFCDQLSAEMLIKQIPRDAMNFDAFLCKQMGNVLSIWLFFGEIVNDNMSSLSGHGNSNCATNARITSCDQRTTADKTAVPFVAMFTAVGLGGEVSLQDWEVLWRKGELQVVESSPRVD